MLRNENKLYQISNTIRFNIPLQIACIASCEFIDTGLKVSINSNDKAVYSYLCGLGLNYGYNSIYPSIDKIASNLGISERTVSRIIDKLVSIKLVKIKKVKRIGKFDHNHYWIYRPNIIDRVHWFDRDGKQLTGSHYNYQANYKNKTTIDSRDYLLIGLIKNLKGYPLG